MVLWQTLTQQRRGGESGSGDGGESGSKGGEVNMGWVGGRSEYGRGKGWKGGRKVKVESGREGE